MYIYTYILSCISHCHGLVSKIVDSAKSIGATAGFSHVSRDPFRTSIMRGASKNMNYSI